MKSFEIAESDIFDLSVDNIYTVTLAIRNVGGTDILSIAADDDSSNDGDDNWEITFYVTDNSTLESSDNTIIITSEADSSSATNMAAGVASGDTLTLTSVYAMINVPADDCVMYDYICASVVAGSSANYTDDDSTNNVICYSIGDQLSVYEEVCAGERIF